MSTLQAIGSDGVCSSEGRGRGQREGRRRTRREGRGRVGGEREGEGIEKVKGDERMTSRQQVMYV